MQEEFITSKEYAERHQLSHSHIKQLCRHGRIPRAKKVGRDWLICVSETGTEEKGSATTKAIAKGLGFSASHMRRLIREGRIKALKRGRDWIITDLEQIPYMRQRKAKEKR
ncbi:helix-turn-helix domain-containing protein [Chloroflexota bacterium]